MQRFSKVSEAVSVDHYVGCGGTFEDEYSSLWDFLTDPTWEDGSARRTGTVMLLVEDGVVKAWLHDRDGPGASLWVSGPDLPTLLRRCCDAIGSGSADWRRDRPQPTGSRKK